MKQWLSAAAATLALVAAPVVHAADAARAAAPVESSNAMGAGLPLSVLIVLLTVLGGAIYLLVDDDNDRPDSP